MYLLIYFFALLGFQPLKVDEAYNILQVQGSIYDETKKQDLKRGMVINANDKIIFKSANAKAVVISSMKGRLVLSQPKKSYNVNSGNFREFQAFVKDVILPLPKVNMLATKGVSETVMDIPFYFGDSVFYVIGDELKIKLSKSVYPLDMDNLLVFRYVYGDLKVNKRIGYTEDNVIKLNKSELFVTSAGQKISPDSVKLVELIKYKPSSKYYESLTSFQIVFLDANNVEEELRDLARLEKGQIPTDTKKKLDYYKYYFYQTYGKTDDEDLQKLLEKAGLYP